MFTVYHSNQHDLLQTLVAEIIAKQSLRNPFQPEIILVQNNSIAHWIQIELASKFGIAANIDFPSPINLIWQILTRILPEISDKNIFIKSEIIWRLMYLLPRLCNNPNFLKIKEYLCDDKDQRKRFQLSSRIADLFNKYILYRPDWLENWKNKTLVHGMGTSQLWQSELWQALLAEFECTGNSLWHFSNLTLKSIQILTQNYINPTNLPERIFIYGFSILPFDYLQALGRHIDIHLMLMNPCRYYWGNIPNQTFLNRLLRCRRRHYKYQNKYTFLGCSKQLDVSFDELGKQQVSNPLLTSWGQQGLNIFHSLIQLDNISEVDAFIKPVSDNLLGQIQKDILMLKDHTNINLSSTTYTKYNKKRLLKPDDRSLSLHVCHSLYREVEVLHDNLLAMIMNDSTLRPRDIIVMVTDIDRYTPAIQAVFGSSFKKCFLPFTISDRRMRYIHPILTTFLNLLELPLSRFNAEEIMKLLEVPSLALRFSINKQELQLLRQWVTETGIRWGLDNETFNELKLPYTGQNTWKFGLTRMLLGYAMDSEYGDWQGILPYDESRGLMAILAGKLAEFIEQLRQWRNKLAQPHTLDYWTNCIREIINDFFVLDSETESALILLEHQWQHILEYGLKIGYNQTVPFVILYDELITRLNKKRISQKFLSGAINFCNLTSKRSIQFRVVCILGMNDDVYPRTFYSEGFDLIAQHPRYGDYNQNHDDRYLFLETLLSAKQRLYISFIGRNVQDNSIKYPSILINELTDYIINSFYLPGDENIDNNNSSENVRFHLYQWHSRMPFAPENFLPGSENQSFADEWLLAASAKDKAQQEFSTPLKSSFQSSLSIKELLYFYYNPIRAWFTQRLSVSFNFISPPIATEEPFIINGLTRYQINKKILNVILSRGNIDGLFSKICAAGVLPFGNFGKLYWDEQYQNMLALSKLIQIWQLPETYNIEVDLTLANTKLFGWLSHVQKNGLLRWSPKVLSVRDGLLLWLEHLIYCAMGGKGESRMFGVQGEWSFGPLSSMQAKEFLIMLISDYQQGMNKPLILCPHSGGAWLRYCFNQKTRSIIWEKNVQKQANNKIIQAWHGTTFTGGEGDDPYIQRLIYKLNKQVIEKIIFNAQRYLLPLFMFNLSTTKF